MTADGGAECRSACAAVKRINARSPLHSRFYVHLVSAPWTPLSCFVAARVHATGHLQVTVHLNNDPRWKEQKAGNPQEMNIPRSIQNTYTYTLHICSVSVFASMCVCTVCARCICSCIYIHIHIDMYIPTYV
jgi:hypothetical protein